MGNIFDIAPRLHEVHMELIPAHKVHWMLDSVPFFLNAECSVHTGRALTSTKSSFTHAVETFTLVTCL